VVVVGDVELVEFPEEARDRAVVAHEVEFVGGYETAVEEAAEGRFRVEWVLAG
jgi:hypothetical protein